mmetsp:Transcript_21703/g.39616  ORF Transcript_21703/g.39616 Transcript_21703/m.39616 type:complete len:317 (+) Transcript_21703:2714-3664(+)
MEGKRSSLTHKFSAALEEIENLQITRRELLDRISELERAFKQELVSHEEDLQQAKEDIDNLTEENRILREQLQGDRREVRRAQSVEQDAEELAAKHRDLLQAHKGELERQAAYEMLLGQLKTDLQHKDQELQQQHKFNSAIEKAKKHLAEKYQRVKKELTEVKNDLVKKADEFIKWRDDVFLREQNAKACIEEHRRIIKKVAQLEAELKEAQKRATSADAEIKQKNERMKTLRALNAKLEVRVTEADECIRNMMIELRQVQEAMERMSTAKSSNEASENVRLKDLLSKNEGKIATLMGKLVPLLQKNDQLSQIIEM